MKDRLRSYIGKSVRRLIRPVALCVVLVVANVPAVSLACELSCTSEQVETATHPHGHHPAAASQGTVSGAGGVVLTAAREMCGHALTDGVAISVSASRVKALAPAVTLEGVPVVDPTCAAGVISLSTNKSPPGFPRPLSTLRI